MDTATLQKIGKAWGLGTLITTLGFTIFYLMGLLLVDRVDWKEFAFVFGLWTVLTSVPVYYFKLLKKNKTTVYKVLGLGGFLTVLMLIDGLMDMPDNPVTLLLLVLFWIGVAYLIFPSFIQKYRFYLLGIYACIVLYFTYVRLFSESMEYYYNHEKAMALTFFILPIPVFFVLWGYEQWRWLQNLKAAKSAAELALLKTQVNPHFFFNTLNNLYSLTVSHSDKAPEVILKLSEIMRYTIYEGKKDLVTLENEISFLENYIELHKIRYHKSVEITFDHEVVGDIEVAPLLFIFLLENAFKHGVEKLRTNAYIHAKLIASESEILFEIENNFDPEEPETPKGIGLENLKKRLDLIYPKLYSFEISTTETTYKAQVKIEIS